jgi:hypothetical protein
MPLRHITPHCHAFTLRYWSIPSPRFATPGITLPWHYHTRHHSACAKRNDASQYAAPATLFSALPKLCSTELHYALPALYSAGLSTTLPEPNGTLKYAAVHCPCHASPCPTLPTQYCAQLYTAGAERLMAIPRLSPTLPSNTPPLQDQTSQCLTFAIRHRSWHHLCSAPPDTAMQNLCFTLPYSTFAVFYPTLPCPTQP